MILKAHKINIHPPRGPLIIEVLWQPPLFSWIKANTEGDVVRNPSKVACGGIFRDHNGFCIGSFAQNIDTNSVFSVEIHAAMVSIEIPFYNNW